MFGFQASNVKEIQRLKLSIEELTPANRMDSYQLKEERALAIKLLQLYLDVFREAIKFTGSSQIPLVAQIKTLYASIIAPFQSNGTALIELRRMAGTVDEPSLLTKTLTRYWIHSMGGGEITTDQIKIIFDLLPKTDRQVRSNKESVEFFKDMLKEDPR